MAWALVLLCTASVFLANALWRKNRRIQELERNISGKDEAIRKRVRSNEDETNRILAILESMSEGVLVVDAADKIVLTNAALSSILGLKGSLSGAHFWEIFRDPAINEMIKKALTDRAPAEAEHSPLLTESTFEIRVSPIFSGRTFLGCVAVFHDVTKLKKLERLRSEFIADVSHEWKTPLTSIMGFVETLKEGAIDDSENRLKFLNIIEDHSKKLHRLIEDLLRLSKIESGAETPAFKPVDLPALVRKVIENFSPAISAKKLSVELAVPAGLSVKADARLIEEALSNIVDNAIKYNKPEGLVRITASTGDGLARLEIKDTGCGIAPADLPRVFERFFRADRSRSRETGGSGLGLSIVKHIAELHGGSVHAASSEHGSTFRLEFPVS